MGKERTYNSHGRRRVDTSPSDTWRALESNLIFVDARNHPFWVEAIAPGWDVQYTYQVIDIEYPAMLENDTASLVGKPSFSTLCDRHGRSSSRKRSVPDNLSGFCGKVDGK